MEIPDTDTEEQAPDPAQDRIAQITVERRHGPGSDPSPEAVAHDQIHALAQLVHKDLEAGEIVTVIGITHDDVFAARRGDASQQGRTVAFLRHIHHPGPQAAGYLPGSVRAAVVRYQHLSVDAGALQIGLGLHDAGGQCLGFVQAGHQDSQFTRMFHSIFPWPRCGRTASRLHHRPFPAGRTIFSGKSRAPSRQASRRRRSGNPSPSCKPSSLP